MSGLKTPWSFLKQHIWLLFTCFLAFQPLGALFLIYLVNKAATAGCSGDPRSWGGGGSAGTGRERCWGPQQQERVWGPKQWREAKQERNQEL